jgi:hypothetical protein
MKRTAMMAENPENDPFGVDLESKIRTNLQNKVFTDTVLTIVFLPLKTRHLRWPLQLSYRAWREQKRTCQL